MPLRALTPKRVLAALAACLTAACGLDTNGLGPVPVDAGASGPGTTSLVDAALSPSPSTSGPQGGGIDAAPGASLDASVAPSPSSSDAAPTGPSAQDDAATSEAGIFCDLDGDGYLSAASDCGGNDCCDNDARAHPGQTSFFTTADACSSFDYDCDGKTEPEYAQVNCTIAIFACNGSGFEQAPPACGVVATYDTCNLGLGCYTSQTQEAQGCR